MENSKNSPPVKKLTFEEEVNQVEIKNREKFYFENVFKDLCALEKEPSSDENSKEKRYLREIEEKVKLKQMKIQKLHNQLVLTTNDINKIDFSFTNEAKTDLDLNLALSYIGYSISLLNYNSKTKFCDNLLDLNINLNSKKLR